MKKIGIITIASLNYGNRLQCYATQKCFQSLNAYECENLVYLRPYCGKKANLERLFKIVTLDHGHICEELRYKKYKQFDALINYSEREISKVSDNKDYLDQFYCFVTGSDQVWNPFWRGYPVELLSFTDKRKIAFAASFGVDRLPEHRINDFKDGLESFEALSVREEAGAKIIKDLTGRDATVLVDPTMLLTKEEWRKVVKKPSGAKEGYILTYFLSPKCDAAKEKLEEIRDGREVYELLNEEDKVAGTAGPSEFLWLFDHADIILTDSFHACVFSFLFNKPFIVYDRNWDGENMNSRLDTLLSKFHLERKYAGSGLDNDIWEHDYEDGYKQLEMERKKTMGFLKNALEG